MNTKETYKDGVIITTVTADTMAEAEHKRNEMLAVKGARVKKMIAPNRGKYCFTMERKADAKDHAKILAGLLNDAFGEILHLSFSEGIDAPTRAKIDELNEAVNICKRLTEDVKKAI